jgi:hypothetical protein
MNLELNDAWLGVIDQFEPLTALLPMQPRSKKVKDFMVFVMTQDGICLTRTEKHNHSLQRFLNSQVGRVSDDELGCESLILHLQTRLLLPPDADTWSFTGLDYMEEHRIVFIQANAAFRHQPFWTSWVKLEDMRSLLPPPDAWMVCLFTTQRLLPHSDQVKYCPASLATLHGLDGVLSVLPVKWWKTTPRDASVTREK